MLAKPSPVCSPGAIVFELEAGAVVLQRELYPHVLGGSMPKRIPDTLLNAAYEREPHGRGNQLLGVTRRGYAHVGARERAGALGQPAQGAR